MTREDKTGGWSVRRATRFYIPLLIQAFSQSLTYPLVAAVVTHGPDGTATLTAFAQGQMVMFMIGALSGGLVTTGMVFARTREGYRSFMRLTNIMMFALLSVQVAVSLPPLNGLVFGRLLNLPPRLAAVASETLLWGLPLHAAFFQRNISLAVLFNARESAAANNATFVRILATLAASWAFVEAGWTGARWGLLAMTVPAIVEYLLSWWFARPFVKALAGDGRSARVPEQLRFTIPLSLGGFMLSLAPFMIAAFVGRTDAAVAALAIHYVTIGVANAFAFSSLRMQAVTIQFPPEYPGDRRVGRYALATGAILGACLAVPACPGVADWYFRFVQNIPAEDVYKARIVMAAFALWPVLQSLRGHLEGLAAVRRRPRAILAGQIAYLAALVAALAASLRFGAPGWLMGAGAVLCATAATVAVLRRALAQLRDDATGDGIIPSQMEDFE